MLAVGSLNVFSLLYGCVDAFQNTIVGFGCVSAIKYADCQDTPSYLLVSTDLENDVDCILLTKKVVTF